MLKYLSALSCRPGSWPKRADTFFGSTAIIFASVLCSLRNFPTPCKVSPEPTPATTQLISPPIRRQSSLAQRRVSNQFKNVVCQHIFLHFRRIWCIFWSDYSNRTVYGVCSGVTSPGLGKKKRVSVWFYPLRIKAK